LGGPGKNNAVTDVAGLLVGHYTDIPAASGASVVICPEGAAAGVDVRGAAPGTRETDLLDPVNLVDKVQAVVLAGGSVFGLAVADGVVQWLAEKGWGFPLGEGRVAPIVPAAVLFDLGRGLSFRPPVSPEWGWEAGRSAENGPVAQGSVGAGTGAVSGGIKGGLGTASLVLGSGLTVGALAVVNSFGSVIDPASGLPFEIGLELESEFQPAGRRAVKLPLPTGEPAAGRNTTIGVVATDAVLTKAQASKVAQMAQDGLARAIRPAHTMFDGDTIFCLATGRRPVPDEPGFFSAPLAGAVTDIGAAAADCFARAAVKAVLKAQGLGVAPAWQDLESI
jgi:L-aminopeptidase/D-esterase-like protein